MIIGHLAFFKKDILPQTLPRVVEGITISLINKTVVCRYHHYRSIRVWVCPRDLLRKAAQLTLFPSDSDLPPTVDLLFNTNVWEQRKVGDYLVESRIKGNAGNEARKITVKLWGKGVVEKNDFGGSEHTQYYIRRAGQFIYSKLDFLNSAFGVIPENLDGFESTADLPAFDLTNMNPYYLYYVAIQEDFYLKNGSIADGSRKAKRIHPDTFLSMSISAPEMKEQNSIVDFLQSLDALITLHQRKQKT